MALIQSFRSHFPPRQARMPPAGAYDVIFVLPHMGRGGAQRVASVVANSWAAEGRRVCILSLLDGQGVAHPLHPMVRHVRLTEFAAVTARIGCFKRLGLVICGGRDTWLFRLGASVVHGFARLCRTTIRQRAKLLCTELAGVSAKIGGLRRLALVICGGRDTWLFRLGANVAHGFARFRRLAASVAPGFARFRQLGASVAPGFARFRQLGASVAPGFARFCRATARQGTKLLRTWLRATMAGRLFAVAGKLLCACPRLHNFLKIHPAPVVISFLSKTNVMTVLAARGLPCRVIVSERNDPILQSLEQPWNVLRQLTYRRADVVTANTEGVLESLRKFVPKQRLQVLPNPVLLPSEPRGMAQRDPVFVSVARLVHQKGIDLLVEAYSFVERSLPGWSLSILGDGPEREALEKRARELGLAGRVTFFGHVSPPFEHLWSARVFVLPSRFEGMPNALLEAMGCGLAPIVTDASPGPRECVIPEETGLIVQSENVHALASAMLRLGADAELTRRLGCAARKAVESRSWATVEDSWLDILKLRAKPPERRSA